MLQNPAYIMLFQVFLPLCMPCFLPGWNAYVTFLFFTNFHSFLIVQLRCHLLQEIFPKQHKGLNILPCSHGTYYVYQLYRVSVDVTVPSGKGHILLNFIFALELFFLGYFRKVEVDIFLTDELFIYTRKYNKKT